MWIDFYSRLFGYPSKQTVDSLITEKKILSLSSTLG